MSRFEVSAFRAKVSGNRDELMHLLGARRHFTFRMDPLRPNGRSRTCRCLRRSGLRDRFDRSSHLSLSLEWINIHGHCSEREGKRRTTAASPGNQTESRSALFAEHIAFAGGGTQSNDAVRRLPPSSGSCSCGRRRQLLRYKQPRTRTRFQAFIFPPTITAVPRKGSSKGMRDGGRHQRQRFLAHEQLFVLLELRFIWNQH